MIGATEYDTRFESRLFHVGESRIRGLAYRIAPNANSGDLWTADSFNASDLLQVAEHNPSIRIVGAGCPTILEIGDDDLTMLLSQTRPPHRFGPSRGRRGVGLPLRPPTADKS